MYPKEAWKFKLWHEAMLRGAIVGKPEYKAKAGKLTGYKGSQTQRRRRRRKRRGKKKE